jgi:hypothetical protein
LRIFHRLEIAEDLFKGMERQEVTPQLAPLGHERKPPLSIQMAQLLHMRYQHNGEAVSPVLNDASDLPKASIAATSDIDQQKPRRWAY